MDVSRSSWAEKRDLIKEAIVKCDYCALDFEFTGLNTGRHSAFHVLDTSEERYAKAALSGKNFSVSQVGISCFTKLSEEEEEEGGGEEKANKGDADKGKMEAEAAGEKGEGEKTSSSPQKWRVKSFNAYLFPGYVPLPTSLSNINNAGGPALGQMHDARFMCQAASMNFLARAGFDFNKWVRESVYFVGLQTVGQWRRSLRGKRGAQLEMIVNSRLLRNNALVSTVRTWILDGPQSPTGQTTKNNTTTREEAEAEAAGKGNPPSTSESDYAPFEISSSAVASYGYADAQHLCDDLEKAAATGGGAEGPCFAVVLVKEKRDSSETSKKTKDDNVEEEEEGECPSPLRKGIMLKANKERALKVVGTLKLVEEKLEKLDEHLGMAEILRCIQQAGCPVVVHNGMMDLIHLMQQFHGSTPIHWVDYKKTLRTLIPGGVFDTKVIASELSTMKKEEGSKPSLQIPFDANLQQLHDTLVKKCANPVVVYHEEEYSRYHSEESYYHEAGYDAYLTGYCFASLLQCYGSEEEGEIVGMNPVVAAGKRKATTAAAAASSSASNKKDQQGGRHHIPQFFGPVNEWHNKIHVMNSDYVYFNLGGDDPEPDRDNCVHIRVGKNKQISTQELLQSFRKCGVKGSMNVLWFERQRQEALVRLPDYKAAAQALQLLRYANQSFSATSYRVWRMNGHKQQQQQQQHMNNQGGSRKRGRDHTMSDQDHRYHQQNSNNNSNSNKRVYRRPEGDVRSPRGRGRGRGGATKSPPPSGRLNLKASHQVSSASQATVQYQQIEDPPRTKKKYPPPPPPPSVNHHHSNALVIGNAKGMNQEHEEGEILHASPAGNTGNAEAPAIAKISVEGKKDLLPVARDVVVVDPSQTQAIIPEEGS